MKDHLFPRRERRERCGCCSSNGDCVHNRNNNNDNSHHHHYGNWFVRLNSGVVLFVVLLVSCWNGCVGFGSTFGSSSCYHRCSISSSGGGSGGVPPVGLILRRKSKLFGLKKKDEEKEWIPDYGKTSVEIDKIQLEKKKLKKKKKSSSNPWKRDDLFGQTMIDDTLQELQEREEKEKEKEEMEEEELDERTLRQKALERIGIEEKEKSFPNLTMRRKKQPKVLQMNIGLYCNQACSHCHVESSPLRKQDVMSTDVAIRCLQLLRESSSITTLDITGGAPELCPAFKMIVSTAKQIKGNDLEIIDRCNLTVLQEPGQGQVLIDFLKQHKVRIIASLPCYSADNVNQQRGNGVFDRSIAALLALNDAGYGIPSNNPNNHNGYQLDLVYNPLGAFLPPPQAPLEQKYKQELKEQFNIQFNQLFTITNMPIKRFADFLHRREELYDYMDLLYRNYNPNTLNSLMCLDTISIGYDGKIYDCDFNQQLGYVLGLDDNDNNNNNNNNNNAKTTTTTSSSSFTGLTVFDIESFDDLHQYPIQLDNHCFGCTAGMGSS